MTRFVLLLSVLLFAASLSAQDPTPLPALPLAPYAREDADALKSHLEAARTELAAAKEARQQAETAAAEATDPEAKAALEEAARQAASRQVGAEEKVQSLEAALKAAGEGPTRVQLDARREFDRLVALAAQTQLDLIADPAAEEGRLEGRLAYAIRVAEEELARLARLADDSGDFEKQKGRLYERLSELDKLDYELRWAEERLALSIAAYDQLRNGVYAAYQAYEAAALEALRALREARDTQYPRFRGSVAETMTLPEAARSSADINTMIRDIETRLERRRGRSKADRLAITAFDGRLRGIQEEIDVREDFMERLTAEVERLKEVLASQPANGAKKEDAQSAETTPELADYQKLDREIDGLERDLTGNRAEIERLGRDRERLLVQLKAKEATEAEVTGLVNETRKALADLEARFEVPDDAAAAARSRMETERALYFPHIAVLVLNAELDARIERESAARRDTLQARSQVDVLDRRVERLKARNLEIEQSLLPAKRDEYWREVGRTAGERGLKVLAVILVALLALWGIRRGGTPLVERFVRKAERGDTTSADARQRARTLMTVFMTTAKVVVYILGLMFVVSQFDVDYGPLLVAAGGLSLAVGFGAQSLVKDFFSGFFVLLEGQFSIGDVVEINGKTGTVESLNLRTTVLRSLNGDVHVVPNGEIKVTTNQTRTWSRAVVDIGVAYEEDAASVIKVLDAIGHEMRADENWGRKLLEHIVVGVEQLGDSAVVIRVLLKTRAGEQWGVAREYRLRAKAKFDDLGIEIPWPQRVVTEKAAPTADEREQSQRGKRARILRYVRRAQGELTDEEIALASISVEERDRAKAMANHQAAIATEEAGKRENLDAPQTPDKSEPPAAELSDAERLARQLAAQEMAKREAESRETDDPKPDGNAATPDNPGEGKVK